MYSVHPPSANNGLGSGTVNPAELNSQGATNPATTITPDTSPRGIKRSRSPDNYGNLQTGDSLGDDGNSKSRKRGRPMKPMRAPGVPESPDQSAMPLSSQHPPQTPQAQTAPLPSQLINTTPTQSSPPKTTPKSVIKALPTVRDHTTDQLGPEGDEYIPREYDEQGEKKVTATGHLVDNRIYKCRTFFVPNRGDKLFMLATECARVLGYRDSYLLFNKNRSLYKIIATQSEKEDLIHQEILPFSYRSRQIAIVTAKSMFRQFGSRVIEHGRRVRDDYWEGKARKQGFTEEDLAGEKRPGAAKARDAAAAEASASANLTLGHHGEIVYSNNPPPYGAQPQTAHSGMLGGPGNGQMLPMITLAPEQPDGRLRDYVSSSIHQRPRQELTGPAYQDRIQSSPPTELLQQAHSAADYNKTVNSRRDHNAEYLQRQWRQPHEAPPPSSLPIGTNDGLSSSSQALQSPRTSQSGMQQSTMSQQNPPHIITQPTYSQAPRQQNPIAQSPMRVPPNSMRNDMGAPGMTFGTGQLNQAGSPYGFAPQNQMYPPSQAQHSPQHAYPSYPSQHQSPHIPQSPHNPPPQLRHSGSNPQMQPGLQYPGMQGLGQSYPAPGRGLYQEQPPQQYMQQATTAGPQPVSQGWAPQQQQQGQTGNSWGWSGQQQ